MYFYFQTVKIENVLKLCSYSVPQSGFIQPYLSVNPSADIIQNISMK